MNKVTRKVVLLCPSVLAGALVVAGLSAGCGDRPPSCNPEGDGNGTVGPTQPPVFGPGGPGSPPDGDALETDSDTPDTYSTNAAGEVCLCSPYQTGCSSTPAAPKSCDDACKAGYARYDLYCQNEASDPLRSKCEQSAQQALYSCVNSRRDKGCYGPCANLQLVFQTFCRDWAKDQACWSVSNDGNAACVAKG
jgi:hypothetical protein